MRAKLWDKLSSYFGDTALRSSVVSFLWHLVLYKFNKISSDWSKQTLIFGDSVKYFLFSSFSLSGRFRISCLLNLSLLTAGITGVVAHLTIEYFMCVCDIISYQGGLNIAKDDLQLLILLFVLPKFWDYRCASPCLAIFIFNIYKILH